MIALGLPQLGLDVVEVGGPGYLVVGRGE